MEIKQSDDGKKGRFYVEEDGRTLAEMTYVWTDEHKFIIDHTDVGEELKGKNAGKQLLTKAVEFARAKQLKILPLCPFARAVMYKHEADYADVLFKP